MPFGLSQAATSSSGVGSCVALASESNLPAYGRFLFSTALGAVRRVAIRSGSVGV